MMLLRGLYATIMYTLGLPLSVLGVIFGFIAVVVINLIFDKRMNLDGLKGCIKAVKEGIMMVHKHNVRFVIYGSHYPEVLEEL